MAQLVDRADASIEGRVDAPPSARPVVLATLSVRIDPSAERMALETALEAHSELIIANLLPLRPYPMTAILAPDYVTLPHEEDLDAVRATAQRAAELGIRTQLLRISTPRPIEALLEVCRERAAGLLVFGPDLRRTSRLSFRLTARRVRRRAPCLVWIAPDG
ncbi:MAG TPA: universal stress protein [Solirubrobacteraceae bacterium]|nr:universal stress protein [Solirubrobacteraceae bacterium]